eukprot:Opistho-2@24061
MVATKINANFLNAIRVSFSAWDARSASAREFLRYARSSVTASNPKCVVESDIRTDGADPTIEITYVDGSKEVLQTKDFTIQPLLKVLKDRVYTLEIRQLIKTGQGAQ